MARSLPSRVRLEQEGWKQSTTPRTTLLPFKGKKKEQSLRPGLDHMNSNPMNMKDVGIKKVMYPEFLQESKQ
jgi:hypothetical protein